jgi:GNAT superfamily N-acetyltransferase
MAFDAREIRSADDPAFAAAMELYIGAFPPDQRESVSSFARVLRERDATRHSLRSRLLVAEDRLREVAGMAFCQSSPRTRLAYLAYVTTHPQHRRKGVGSLLVDTAIRLCRADAGANGRSLSAVMLEIERVELAATPEESEERESRLKFFQSMGAETVSSSYVQPKLESGTKAVPLHLMAVHLDPTIDRAKLADDFLEAFF